MSKNKKLYIVAAFFGISVFTLLSVYSLKDIIFTPKHPVATPAPVVSPSPIPETEETQAEVIFYDKEPYETGIVNYSDVILPQNSINAAYMSETIFVGDSNTEGLSTFEHLPAQNVLGKHSMNIQGVTEKAYIPVAEDNPETPDVDESQYITMVQSLATKQPKRIIINFGTNNAGKNAPAKNFIAQYSYTLQQIKTVCPNTQIVVAAILPVCEERENLRIRQDTIDNFNLALAQLCSEQGYGFLHYPEVFKDNATGYADTDYFSVDGIHLNGAGYRLLLDYAENHQYN